MKMIKLMDFNKYLRFLKMASAYWVVIRKKTNFQS